MMMMHNNNNHRWVLWEGLWEGLWASLGESVNVRGMGLSLFLKNVIRNRGEVAREEPLSRQESFSMLML